MYIIFFVFYAILWLRYKTAVSPKASEVLHITQPTISRAFKELEDELGQILFERGARSISLTYAGELLYHRALTILELFNQTKAEVSAKCDTLQGTVKIVAGESLGNKVLTDLLAKFHKIYPKVRIDLASGDENYVRYLLKSGLADFGILYFSTGVGFDDFDYVLLKHQDPWGIITSDPKLKALPYIEAKLLKKIPLICYNQIFHNDELKSWLSCPISSLKVVATYELIYNAYLLTQSGFGNLLCFKDLVNLEVQNTFKFIPLDPPLLVQSAIVWAKAYSHSEAANYLLNFLKKNLQLKGN